MWEMGVHKDEDSLSRCLQRLSICEEDLHELCLPRDQQPFLALSLPHLLGVARVIAQAASMRRKSRGPHYRTNNPSSDDTQFGRPIVAQTVGDRISFEFRSLT
jgi:succinate dehydrogenase/fumarate reductase flavoprotein subunit